MVAPPATLTAEIAKADAQVRSLFFSDEWQHEWRANREKNFTLALGCADAAARPNLVELVVAVRAAGEKPLTRWTVVLPLI